MLNTHTQAAQQQQQDEEEEDEEGKRSKLKICFERV